MRGRRPAGRRYFLAEAPILNDAARSRSILSHPALLFTALKAVDGTCRAHRVRLRHEDALFSPLGQGNRWRRGWKQKKVDMAGVPTNDVVQLFLSGKFKVFEWLRASF